MKALYIGLMAGDNGFTRPFRANVTEYKEINCGDPLFNTNAQLIATEFNPDLIFIQIQASNVITEETLKVFNALRCFVINWTGDCREEVPKWMIEAAKHVDLTCFSNMTDVRKLRKLGFDSEYLEIGFDPSIYQPIGNARPVPDIVFMGNNYGNQFPLGEYRIEMVDFLRRTYPHKFGLYGTGWPVCNGNLNGSQQEEAEAYRGARIAINLSHFNYERYNSDRILRIMGTGVPLCLTMRYKGIEKDYTPGVNLVAWDNFEELKQNIDFYLNNEEERKSIVEAGHKLVNKKFSFEQMVKNIIKLAS